MSGPAARRLWPERAPLGGLAPRRRVFVVGMIAVLVVVGAAVTGSVVREWGVPPAAEARDMGTIVLVPGYGGGSRALEALSIRLRVIARPTVVMALPADGTGDLNEQAAAIDSTVRGLLRHGETSVDLVGYSAGGVAVWQYLQTGRTAPAVRRVVTLGAPLQGAEVAAVGAALVPGVCAPACRQLVPGSALLSGLAARPRPSVPWLSLWSDTDRTVTPPDSAALPGIASIRLQSICPASVTSHTGLPTDALPMGLVLRALGTRALPAPTVAECAQLQNEGIGRPVLSGTI